jgi:integrase
VERLKQDPTKRLELPDAALPGMYLIIQTSGVKSWAVRYRHEGKPRKHTLGTYPKLGLLEARGAARKAFDAIAHGRDPGAEKVEERRAAKADPDQDLVSGAVESFLKRHVRVNLSESTARSTEHLFNKHVLPRWRTRRLDAIKRADVVSMLDAIVDAGSPVAANRVLAAVRKFFNWCLDRGLLEHSPCARVKAPTEEVSRDRVLSDDELRWAWLAAETAGAPFGPLVQLLILTAQRRDEVGRMTRSEVQARRALWTIPKERAKNGIANDVPLTGGAMKILDAVPKIEGKAGLVFTSTGESAFSGYSKSKIRLDRDMLAVAKKEAEKRGEDPDEVTISPWRLHDLRRTAASGMARLGQPVHVIEAVLNHVSGQISGVAAVYNRYRYLDEKRAALEAWGGHVATMFE